MLADFSSSVSGRRWNGNPPAVDSIAQNRQSRTTEPPAIVYALTQFGQESRAIVRVDQRVLTIAADNFQPAIGRAQPFFHGLNALGRQPPEFKISKAQRANQ